jgi:hypothetical protein
MLNASNKTRIVSLSRLAVHVRAGSSFILTRSLMQKRKVCPTRSYPGFVRGTSCHYFCGTAINVPVCKSRTATRLVGFWLLRMAAAPIAVSIVSRQDWGSPSRRISNLAPSQFSVIYSNPRALVSGRIVSPA